MCFTQELSKILYDRAVSYLNIDTAVSGRDHISVAATPLLYHAIYKAAKMVKIQWGILNAGLSLKLALVQLLLQYRLTQLLSFS